MILVHHPWGWWVFFGGAISDALDGWLARLLKVQSRLGLYLDPLGDKVFVMATTIAWTLEGRFPDWLLGLVLGRDAAILVGSGLIYWKTRRKDFAPSLWGKISTILQLCCVGGCFLLEDWGLRNWVYACAAGTVISGFDYARKGLAMWESAES